ncbi:inositol phosphorylsphingolipid-phospholipase C [Cryptococcus deuterogattii CA1014]|nr:inositol phosphorylsphingolipid-phospholipase C [Cryptococcus deuterogattii CA1014]
MNSQPASADPNLTLKVLSFNVWGLAIVSKDRRTRIQAIAEYLASSSYDIVCLQELWIYKNYEVVREEVQGNLPFSRFFHTGALGSGLAIFTRFPLIAAHALPYSLSGSPAQAFAGDFFVKKAAGNVVIVHPILGEVEIWNTHMHAAGEHPPDTRQAHRIAQSWQLANAVRGGAAKGRYVFVMGDFNSQPWSIPIAMMRDHAHLTDSFAQVHVSANSEISPPPSPAEALKVYGMTCDSPLNTYSAGKPIPENVLERGGKRLDYIFFGQPAIARRRPLLWKYKDEADGEESHGGDDRSGQGYIESGKPLQDSVSSAPSLRCVDSQVILTNRVPGRLHSYSDHFALFSTFAIDTPNKGKYARKANPQDEPSNLSHSSSSEPLMPILSQSKADPIGSNVYAVRDPFKKHSHSSNPSSPRTSTSSIPKASTIRSALGTLRLYTRISSHTSTAHLRICGLSFLALVGLTVGSAWQPKSWLQPIFTILAGLLGAAAVTFLYTGFIWGRWEVGLLTEVTEEMELELRVVEMEENVRR